MIAPNPTPPPAVPAASADEPLCADCLAHEGLCSFHARGVLPQLAQPWWYQLVGQTLVEQRSRQTEGAPTREARKATKKADRKASRLARALAGEFTPARPQAA